MLKANDGDRSLVDTMATLGHCDAIGIYFGAEWCPSCNQFAPDLMETHKTMIADGKRFEVVYASVDKVEDGFDAALQRLPFLAMP